jgi:PKD repeat protein
LVRMRRQKLATLLLTVALLLPGLGAIDMNSGSHQKTDSLGSMEALAGDISLDQGPGTPLPGFTVNSGQFHDSEVQYYAHLPTGGFAFKTSGMLINIEVPIETEAPRRTLGTSPGDALSQGMFQELRYGRVSGCTIELFFEGGNDVSPVGSDPFTGVYNYLNGDDPDTNAKGVQTYSRVVYEDLYDGIDLVYRLTPQGLKYEFVIAPGADPSTISVRVEGHDDLYIDDGDLVIGTSVNEIRDSGLDVFYQDAAHEKVRASFDLQGPDRYGFLIEGRDADRTLVIDPLVFSTFLATSEFEEGYSVAVDGDGNPVVAGITNDGSFPTTTGAYQETHSHDFDVFITKMDADGSTLIFSTFLGSTGGESVADIFLDDSGNIYVGGYTSSGNFPTTTDAFQTTISGHSDAFVSKLSPDGSRLLASTLLGGFWDDGVESVTADAAGNMYITGITASGDFPVTPGAANTSGTGYNAFVCKVNSTATDLVYSTYLGGTGQDAAYAILLNDDGSVYVAGSTGSDDFPISANAYQKGRQTTMATAFVTRVASDGASFEASTFLGGTRYQEAIAVDMDAEGEVHVVGYTNSNDFPVTVGAFQTTIGSSDEDVFVTRMDGDLTAINTSTFIGGDTNDQALDGGLDPEGNVVICGYTQSTDYPTTTGAAQTAKGAFDDAFFTKLSWNYTHLEYSTYLGGVDLDWGHGVAASGTLHAYVTGETFSSTFPTTGGAFNTSFGGKRDAFLTKITLDLNPPIAIAGPDVTIDQHESVTFNGSSSTDNIGIVNWTWSLNYGGEDVELYGPVVSLMFDDAGLYRVTLQVTDTSSHEAIDILDVTVLDITIPVADAGLSKIVEQGATVVLDGSGSSDNVGIVTWNWSFNYGGGPVVLSGESTSFVFEDAGDYTVTLTVWDAAGHNATDNIMVHVEDTTPPVADAGDDITVDQHEEFELNGSGSRDNIGIVQWTWSFIYAGVPDELLGEVARFTFDIPGTYEVILRVEDGSGYYTLDTMDVIVRDSTSPTVDPGPDQEVDQGATVVLDGTSSEDNVGIATYVWTFEYGGSDVILEDARSLFKFDLAGIYTVTLNVTDAAGNSAFATLNVTVNDVTAPTSVAGDDKTIDQGVGVTLDGSSSTDNVGIVTFTWTFEYDGSIQSLDGVATLFTFVEVGEFVVSLTVEDRAGLSDTDEMVITVLDTMAPVADPGADGGVDQGGAAQLDGSASSDNVGIVRYEWTFIYEVQEVTLEGETASYTFDRAGIYEINLDVWDAAENSDQTSFTLTVRDTEAPVADIDIENTLIVKGETAGLKAVGSSDNVGIVKYTWTYKEDGKTVTLEGFSVGPRFDEVGDHEVTLTVEDAAGNIGQETFTITVESNAWMWAVLAIICVGIVLAILFVMQRRAKAWPDVEEGPEV